MLKPEVPKNESRRLAALKSLNILDTPAEERLDRLTRLAARHFNVPICLISLVDENRQWFKSSVGLDVAETPRDVSFCGHAILEEGVTVVPNALEDERFHDNPLTTGEPEVVFYAGATLAAKDGSRIGTLCLIDHAPREFSVTEKAVLKSLADVVERELFLPDAETLDSLTGISSRYGFMRLTDQALLLGAIEGEPVCVVFLDLDDLDEYAAEHGQQQADAVLLLLSEQLRAGGRGFDVVGRFDSHRLVAVSIGDSIENTESQIAALKSDYEAACLARHIAEPLGWEARINALYNDHVANIRKLLDVTSKKAYF